MHQHREALGAARVWPFVGVTVVASLLTIAWLIASPPDDPLTFLVAPFLCAGVVFTAWLLAHAARRLDWTEPVASILGLAFFVGLFLLAVALYLLFVVVDTPTQVLPMPVPSLLIVGALLCAVGSLPGAMGNLAQSRATGGWRGSIAPLGILVFDLSLIALLARVLIVGPLTPD